MKIKYKRDQVLPVANALLEHLTPFCERIEICGSLRRGKPEVSDIELLYTSKLRKVADGLFDTRVINEVSDHLDELLRANVIAKRPNVKGHLTWGPLNKLGVHVASGIPVDFFSEPEPLDWWRSLVIRTGSADFNTRLMASAAKNGMGAHAYSVGLEKNGVRVPVNSEQEFIEKCGVKFLMPYQRSA